MAQPVADEGAIAPDDDGTLAQQPLLLVMPVKLDRLDELWATLRALPVDDLNRALDKVGTVHSTRFVILEDEERRWAKLIVVAIYDGTVRQYISAFARELRDAFNTLLPFIADDPPMPVQEHVDSFIEYVERHDVKSANGQTYRANPGLTALDIWEALSRDDRPPVLS